jgi:3-hydroxy-9,10-secoandrosta-1,3,5(10)-triene-9,17-dione monooxygenase
MAIEIQGHVPAEKDSLLLPECEGITREELIERARGMIPILRERAAATEQARHMLPETLADFKRLGFFRICQPSQFGGFEMGIDVLQEVLIELARGDGSSAWTLGILSGHSWFVAGFPLEAQREIYGGDGHAIVSTTLGGRGVARRVDGGLRISGRYAVHTGCDVATRHCLGAYLEDGDGGPESGYFCIVRPEEVKIVDNWFVLGMRGTGSKSIEIEDVFVPEHLALPVKAVNDQETPGSKVHANPFYHAPWRGFVFLEITGTAVGLAFQACDLLDEIGRSKPIRIPGGPVSSRTQMELPMTRHRLAQAQTLANSARALLLTEARRFMEMAQTYDAKGQKFSAQENLEFAANCSRVVRLSVEAVDHAFEAAGTTAAYAGQPMERCFRDIRMMSTHAAYRFDGVADRWARAHFDLGAEVEVG